MTSPTASARTATIAVTLTVEVDLDAWCTEYGLQFLEVALAKALQDLGEPGWYLRDYKWQELARLVRVTAEPVLPVDPSGPGEGR